MSTSKGSIIFFLEILTIVYVIVPMNVRTNRVCDDLLLCIRYCLHAHICHDRKEECAWYSVVAVVCQAWQHLSSMRRTRTSSAVSWTCWLSRSKRCHRGSSPSPLSHAPPPVAVLPTRGMSCVHIHTMHARTHARTEVHGCSHVAGYWCSCLTT